MISPTSTSSSFSPHPLLSISIPFLFLIKKETGFYGIVMKINIKIMHKKIKQNLTHWNWTESQIWKREKVGKWEGLKGAKERENCVIKV